MSRTRRDAHRKDGNHDAFVEQLEAGGIDVLNPNGAVLRGLPSVPRGGPPLARGVTMSTELSDRIWTLATNALRAAADRIAASVLLEAIAAGERELEADR